MLTPPLLWITEPPDELPADAALPELPEPLDELPRLEELPLLLSRLVLGLLGALFTS